MASPRLSPKHPGDYVSNVTTVVRRNSSAFRFSFCINGKVGSRTATSQAKAEELHKIAKAGGIPDYQRRRFSEEEKAEITGKYQARNENGDWIYSCAPLAQMYGVSRNMIENVLREKGIPRRTRSEINRVRANRPEDKKRTAEQLRGLHRDPEIKKRRITSLKKTLEAPEQRARLTHQSHKWRAYQTTVLEAAKHLKAAGYGLDELAAGKVLAFSQPAAITTGGKATRHVGRPPNEDLRRRVRELRSTKPTPTSWARVKLTLDREMKEKRSISTYRDYAGNS